MKNSSMLCRVCWEAYGHAGNATKKIQALEVCITPGHHRHNEIVGHHEKAANSVEVIDGRAGSEVDDESR